MPTDRDGGPSGLLLVDKPTGPTSFDVVARVRRALGTRRAGHTGTLDPLATGLLPIAVGDGTKLVNFLTDHDKAYRATLKLGQGTDTLDAEGSVVAEDDPERVAAVGVGDVEAVLPRFLGEIEQRPPAFSAIKVDGRRLYDLARAGEAVEAPLRVIRIDALKLVEAAPPYFTLDVACSKGTYIRSLAADLAAALGLHAHLTALRRTVVGRFRVEDALPLATVMAEPALARARLIPPAEALIHLPAIALEGAALDAVAHGRPLFGLALPAGTYRGLDSEGHLVAVLEVETEGRGTVRRGFRADA